MKLFVLPGNTKPHRYQILQVRYGEEMEKTFLNLFVVVTPIININNAG